MENTQGSNAILFNNRLYQKRPAGKALCLNPNCKARRLCKIQAQGNSTVVNHEEHQACGGWFHSITKLRRWHMKEDPMQLGSVFSTDYFENPIESIYYMEAFGSIRWEDHLFQYFGTIKSAIQDELGKLYIKCQRNIHQHLLSNKEIFQKLNSFYQNALNQQEGIEQYYRQHLQKDLKAIQQNGVIHISNQELMNRSLDLVIQQIHSMELGIWGKELKHDLSQRIKVKSQKEEMMKFAMQSDTQEINSKVNQIMILLKTQLQYIEEEKGTKVFCSFCNKSILSQAQSVKQRKQECRTLLLHHMNNYHLEQLSMMLGQHPPIKLTMQGFKKEIKLKNVKKVIVVDKQNVGSINCQEWYLYPDYYFLEVVSQHTEKNAKGRYLVAESKGRDAADLLMVIILTELTKMNMKETVLLTKDHFGQTLRQLFKDMGISLTLSRSLEALGKPTKMVIE